MRGILQDVRFAARTFRRRPAVTLLAVLTLALGVGANTLVFGVTNAVLLRPLPFPDADRLVMLWGSNPRLAVGVDDLPLSAGDVAALREGGRAIERVAAVGAVEANLTGAGDAARVAGASVSSDFFDVASVRPTLGRAFTPEEDVSGAPRVVVISHALWTERFGRSPQALGRTVELDGTPYTVVGVMPAGFAYPGANDLPATAGASSRADFWRPAALGDDRANRQLAVLGRLAPGATLADARAEAGAIAAKLAADHPDTNEGFGLTVRALDEQLLGGVRPAILVLELAVAIVLLVACANLASLMLVRSDARRREFAVRLAVGANRSRILRQLLTESVALAVAGGLAGLALAYWGVGTVRALAPRSIPRLEALSLDWTALAFALAVSAATGVVFGLAPAVAASRADVRGALAASAPRGSARVGRGRGAIVVAEVALLTVLLVGAGLAARSFSRLVAVDPGFVPEGAVAATVPLTPVAEGAQDRARAYFDEAVRRVAAAPGVRSAAVVSSLPLSGGVYAGGFSVRERPELADAEGLVADRRVASPAYFDTMRIPVLSGRAFAETDRAGAPGVAVVSESFARRFLGDTPVGSHVKLGGPDSTRPWLEVVGVVGDVRDAAIERDATPHVYVPFDQMPFTTMTLVARTDGEVSAVAPVVRSTLAGVDRAEPVADVRPLAGYVADATAGPRFAAAVLAGFALVALALAAVGLFGVVADSVGRRTHEIGLRMALGARPGDAVRLVLAQGMSLVAVGALAGLVAAFWAARAAASLLFGVSAADPTTFLAAPAALAAVAFVACYLPARRAARVDPIRALRSE